MDETETTAPRAAMSSGAIFGMHVAFVGSLAAIATALVVSAVHVGAIQTDVAWLKKAVTENATRGGAIIEKMQEEAAEGRRRISANERDIHFYHDKQKP